MSHIRVLICRVDDPASDQMTALAAFDLPETDLTTLKPETALDDLETTTHTTGNAILQRALQAQWDVIDDQLTVQHRQSFPPRTIHADGHEPITVASRFGILTLSRQVCQHLATQTHVIPSNAVLPSHNGIIITRGLHLLGLSVVAGVAVCLRRALARRPRPTTLRSSRTPRSAVSSERMAKSSVRRSWPRSQNWRLGTTLRAWA